MKLGVYVGRFSPLHLGHEAVIKSMLKTHGYKNSVLVIGGSNHIVDERHPFSYNDRRNIIAHRYPKMAVVGIPDYESDADWLTALLDITNLKANSDYTDVVFYAGCAEDVKLLTDKGFTTKIFDRDSGLKTPIVSATEVRELLLKAHDIDKLVDPRVSGLIKSLYEKRTKKEE
jgi:nicotinamide mononucleotide adenylyltransferase